MKKCMVLFLACIMVLGVVSFATAEVLEPQIVYTNDTQTYDKEINGTRWLVEFVKNVDACQQTNEWPCAQDWDFIRSRYCEGWEPGEHYCTQTRCDWFNCMCCEVPCHQGVIGSYNRCECENEIRAFSLLFDKDIDWQSCRMDKDSSYFDKFSWADFVTKVTIEPDCEYIDDYCYKREDDTERHIGCHDIWDDYFDTPEYPYCIPCDVEVLYCVYEDKVCVLDDDDDCGPCPCYDLKCEDDDDDCYVDIICSWFHPDLEFTRENDGATRPTFSEVIYGGRWLKTCDSVPKLIGDSVMPGDDDDDDCCCECRDFFKAGEATFMTRYKWYDYEITNCDECEEAGDVVLWKTRPVYCGDCHYCDPCDPCRPIFEFERFFRMDLLNCDNISQIDLTFPVCCPCDPDVEWGIWKLVEVDDCVEECYWEPLDVTFNKDCDTPLCGEEECECELELSLSGACADDCNPGELCALEGDTFVLGWYLPQVTEGNFGSIVYSAKAYACDPTDCVTADLVEDENPDPCCASGDLFFVMKFDPVDTEGICKVKLCMEDTGNGDFGIFWFNEDTGLWVSLAEGSGEVCATFDGDLVDLLGLTFGAGDPAGFPTEPPVGPGDDDDDNDSGSGGDGDDDDDSSGGGCNVGFAAGMLLFVVPLILLGVRKF